MECRVEPLSCCLRHRLAPVPLLLSYICISAILLVYYSSRLDVKYRRASSALVHSLIVRLTKRVSHRPPHPTFPPFGISQKGDSDHTRYIWLLYYMDTVAWSRCTCTRMLADLRSPPNARHLGRSGRGHMQPHAFPRGSQTGVRKRVFQL